MKTSLIIIALALVACLAWLVWLGSRPDEPDELVGTSVSDTSRGPSFEVNVERPRMDRSLGGILPTKLEAKLFGGELRFDHASRGAKIGSVGHDRLELSADGWDLLIETDGEGRDRSGDAPRVPDRDRGETVDAALPTRRSCHRLSPHHHAGRLRTMLDGRFLVELARCEDAETGKILDTEAGANPGDAWPSAPLTLRGSFNGATRPSLEPKGDHPKD